MSPNRPHLPIMVTECLQYFEGKTLSVFFEGTLGAGGHARAILEAHPEITRYLACDKDPEAIEIARANLEPWKDKIEFIRGDFSHLGRYLEERGIEHVDGFFLI
jgi:16S rRNA (cytosine1402-N4)-methyltransferase